MPSGEHLANHLLNDVLLHYKRAIASGKRKMEACRQVGGILGLTEPTVYSIIQRMRPTHEVAKAILDRGASRLAARVVRKATVVEAIDVLTRQGVLAPPAAKEGAGSGGFFLSVQAGDLGAVKVGVQIGGSPVQQASLPPGDDNFDDHTIDIGGQHEDADENRDVESREEDGGDGGDGGDDPRQRGRRGENKGCRVGPGRSKKVQAAIAEAKARIEAARIKREKRRPKGRVESYQEHRRVSGVDEKPAKPGVDVFSV